MEGDFFSSSGHLQKYSFGVNILFGWFDAMKLHVCVPLRSGTGITELCGCARVLAILEQAHQVAEWKREVSLAIFWAAAMPILIAVKDNHTHTKGV